jgi:acetyl-CoA acetyltransferase
MKVYVCSLIPLVNMRLCQLDMERVNINGGAVR